MIFGIGGDTIDVDSMEEFWMGAWTKRYLVQVQLHHQENQRTAPHRGSMSVGSVTLKAMYMAK